jgi:hypothetical protein
MSPTIQGRFRFGSEAVPCADGGSEKTEYAAAMPRQGTSLATHRRLDEDCTNALRLFIRVFRD